MAEPSIHLLDVATGEKVEATKNVLHERINDLEKDLANCERDLRRERRRSKALERDRQRERDAYEQKDLVARLFDFWQVRCDKKRSKLTPERFDALKRALEWGYSPREIALAIAGAAFDPFITVAKNGRLIKHQDLELILRDGKHVEAYANKAPTKSKRAASPKA
jgi:hypothetical protein